MKSPQVFRAFAILIAFCRGGISLAQLNYDDAFAEARASIENGNDSYGIAPEQWLPGGDKIADSGDGANFILYCFEAGGVCICDNTACPVTHPLCTHVDGASERTLLLGRDLCNAFDGYVSIVTLLWWEDDLGFHDTWPGFFQSTYCPDCIESFVDTAPIEYQQQIIPGCIIVFNDQAFGDWEDNKIRSWGFITEVTFDSDLRISELRFLTRDQGSTSAIGPTPLFSRDNDNNIVGFPLTSFEASHGTNADDEVKYWNSFRIYLVDTSDDSSPYSANSNLDRK